MKTYDFAHIHSATPKFIIAPKTEEELIKILNDFPTVKVSIAGGKFSHGGQTMLNNAIYVDTKYLNKIFNLTSTSITVQAGAKWWQIQRYLDQYNLSVAEMQSYNDFSVGGSISVNCHGRGLKYGSISDTIDSLKILTETGIYIASKTSNTDLFQATIGGYGTQGIILEAILKIEPNFSIEKYTFRSLTCESYYIIQKLKDNKNLVFYNGDIYPTNEKYTYHVCWYKTKLHSTSQRLQYRANWYPVKMLLEQLLRRTTLLKQLRAKFEPNNDHVICWKNYEMSYTTNTLKPLIKFPSTTILQEYFISPNNLNLFLTTMFKIFKKYKVNILNISLRWVHAVQNCILNYAPENRVAIVLYINIWKHDIRNVKIWTQKLIECAISLNGTYYLPYLLLASIEQFHRAYPNYQTLINTRKKYNPSERFSNQFAEKYLKNSEIIQKS